MRKDKIAIVVTIGVSFFILTLIIFMQFKVVYQTDISSIDTMREEDLRSELANWKTKYAETEEQYEDVIETLNKYKEESNSNSQTKKNLEEELENLELLLGKTDVEGKGLIITLKDPENNDSQIDEEEEFTSPVSASELMLIVNYLKDAGAEAISINNKRVVNSTDIVDITANYYIKMNSQRVASPFEIKVIGDPDYLKSALIGTGYVSKIEGWGQTIKFEEKNKVEISKYDGNMETNYIQVENN